jgi:hypothetical protein
MEQAAQQERAELSSMQQQASFFLIFFNHSHFFNRTAMEQAAERERAELSSMQRAAKVSELQALKTRIDEAERKVSKEGRLFKSAKYCVGAGVNRSLFFYL